jgi:hypothetical protein
MGFAGTAQRRCRGCRMHDAAFARNRSRVAAYALHASTRRRHTTLSGHPMLTRFRSTRSFTLTSTAGIFRLRPCLPRI